MVDLDKPEYFAMYDLVPCAWWDGVSWAAPASADTAATEDANNAGKFENKDREQRDVGPSQT